MSAQLARGRDIGRAHRDEAAQTRYIEYAKRTLPKNIDLSGLRVVIDCANGAAYKVAPMALWELGAEVFTIGVEPDGFNINDKVGSTAPEALRAKVKEVRADIGIALDGDADRVIIVDEQGEVVDGDQLMAVIAAVLARARQPAGRRHRRDGDEQSRARALSRRRSASSSSARRWATATCSKRCAPRASMSAASRAGHIILSDFTTTGDGLVAALQLLAVVKEAGHAGVGGLPALRARCRRCCTSVRYKAGKPLDHKLVVQVIAESRDRLGKGGRLVIRESGTEPVIRVMAESDDARLVDAVVDEIAATIKQVA